MRAFLSTSRSIRRPFRLPAFILRPRLRSRRRASCGRRTRSVAASRRARCCNRACTSHTPETLPLPSFPRTGRITYTCVASTIFPVGRTVHRGNRGHALHLAIRSETTVIVDVFRRSTALPDPRRLSPRSASRYFLSIRNRGRVGEARLSSIDSLQRHARRRRLAARAFLRRAPGCELQYTRLDPPLPGRTQVSVPTIPLNDVLECFPEDKSPRPSALAPFRSDKYAPKAPKASTCGSPPNTGTFRCACGSTDAMASPWVSKSSPKSG